MTEKYYAFSCMRLVYIIDDIISETDHFIISKHHGRMKKITNDSAILDTFEDAKQWLIDHETGEVTYPPMNWRACLYAKSREAYGRVTLLPD